VGGAAGRGSGKRTMGGRRERVGVGEVVWVGREMWGGVRRKEWSGGGRKEE